MTLRASKARLHRFHGLVALVALVTGCGRCRGDRPYVPYGIDGGEPDAATASVSPSAVPSVFADASPGDAPPKMATTWEHGGRALRAPDGTYFEQGLFGDVDGDSAEDALVVVRSFAEPAKLSAYLYGTARPGPLELVTSTLKASPRAEAAHDLRRLGKATFAVTLGLRAADATQGARHVALVELVDGKGGASPKVRLELDVADPPERPPLGVGLSVPDVDGDGVADVAVAFEQGERAAARFTFLDRPAGLARDPEEPRKSLGALASRALARARRREPADDVLAEVEAVTALVRAICPDLPGARVADFRPVSGPRCAAEDALGDLAVAETLAQASAGRAFHALRARGRLGGPFVRRTNERDVEARKAVESVVELVAPRDVKVLGPSPLAPKRHVPAFSPLSFRRADALSIVTGEGIVEVDLSTREETRSPDPPWPPAVVAKGGARLVEVYDACRGGPLRATFAPAPNDPAGDAHDVVLPVAPDLGPTCTTSRGQPVAATPIAVGPAGVELFVAGVPILVRADLTSAELLPRPGGSGGAPGGAGGATGSVVALGTPFGVALQVSGKVKLLSSPSLTGDVWGCTPSPDGARVACLVGGKAVVATLP